MNLRMAFTNSSIIYLLYYQEYKGNNNHKICEYVIKTKNKIQEPAELIRHDKHPENTFNKQCKNAAT